MKSKGMSQEQLAESCGVEGPRITKWKKGSGEPSLSQGVRMAKALGVSLDWLTDEMASSVPAPVEGPRTKDDELILRLIEAYGLSTSEALRRLAEGGPEGKPVEVSSERTLNQKLPGNPGVAKVDASPGRRK